MPLPVLPDAIRLGPLALPTGPLLTVAGTLLAYTLAVKIAEKTASRAAGTDARYAAGHGAEPVEEGAASEPRAPVADPALVESLFTRVAVGLLLGAKAADILRSPLSFVHGPQLLLAWPGGPSAGAGAVIGALLLAGPLVARRWREVPAALDVAAAPVLLGLALTALGLPDGRALPLAAGLAGAALVLVFARPRAAFPGHAALGALVLAGAVAVTADLFRPGADLPGGISRFQVTAAAVAVLAYVAAVLLEGAARRRNPKQDLPAR